MIPESSGIAISRNHEGVFWTVNDGGGPTLYAVDDAGKLLATVDLGVDKSDWEDLALAPCGTADCLYVADTGDNATRRERAVIYRLPEPDPTTVGPIRDRVEAFPFRLPDGPHDIEAMFILPGERVFMVSKGGGAPVSLYRYPEPLVPDSLVSLELLQRLSETPRALARQITGAAATPEGTLVALRTYETMSFHVPTQSGLEPIGWGPTNLRTLREAQGEAVALGDEGVVVLTSEAGPLRRLGSIVVLHCPQIGARS